MVAEFDFYVFLRTVFCFDVKCFCCKDGNLGYGGVAAHLILQFSRFSEMLSVCCMSARRS